METYQILNLVIYLCLLGKASSQAPVPRYVDIRFGKILNGLSGISRIYHNSSTYEACVITCMSRDIMDAANYDIETKVCECWVAITEEGEQPTGYADISDASKVAITSWV